MSDFANASKAIKKLTNHFKKFVENQQRAQFPELQRKTIQAYADGVAQLGPATVALTYLASYRSVVGALRVLGGDDAGFEEIDLACLYEAWVLRLMARAYELDTRPGKQPRIQMETAATCWMHAEALGAAGLRTSMDDLVRKVDQGSECIGGKSMSPLCALMAHFALGQDTSKLQSSGWAPIGPYAAAASGKLAASDYDALADYHLKQVSGSGFPEFQSNPYCLIPFELFAIEKRTGVAIGNTKHPLLTSPLAKRRSVPEIKPTEELEAVIGRASTELGL